MNPRIKPSAVLYRAAFAFALAGLLIFGGQIIIWLRIAEWRSFSVAALFYGLGIPEPHPPSSWLELQRIIDSAITTMLDLPASLLLVAVAGLLFALAENEAKREGELARSKR